jgi:hypothetical protein
MHIVTVNYILELLLSCCDRFEIVTGLNFLKHSHFKGLKKCCPYLEECHEPGSFLSTRKINQEIF